MLSRNMQGEPGYNNDMDPNLNFSKIKQMGYKSILLEIGDLRYSYNGIAIRNPKYWIWCILKTLSSSMLLRPVRGPVKKWMEGNKCSVLTLPEMRDSFTGNRCIINCSVVPFSIKGFGRCDGRKFSESIGPPFSHHEQWIWIASTGKQSRIILGL